MRSLPYFWLIQKFQIKLLSKTIFVQILVFPKNNWPVLWKCVRVGWGPWGRLRAPSHVKARQGSASRLSRTWICTWISGKSKRTHWQSSVSTTYNPLFNDFPSENHWKVVIFGSILNKVKNLRITFSVSC